MLPAVDFNDQFPLAAAEIHYVWANRKLADESQAAQSAISHREPDQVFGFSAVQTKQPSWAPKGAIANGQPSSGLRPPSPFQGEGAVATDPHPVFDHLLPSRAKVCSHDHVLPEPLAPAGRG